MNDSNVILNIDEDGVATLTLNRPDKHNAFDDSTIATLITSLEEIAKNKDTRVMILKANGKSFSAGADLDWMKRMASYSYEENLRDANALANLLKILNFLPIPTIARVHGAAMGGGVGLVACCDIAVASFNASFAFTEVKLGLIPATISPYVVRAIGNRAARRYFLTGERFDAETALTLGLVSEVVEQEQLDNKINELITAMLKCGPEAVKAAKALVFEVAEQTLNNDLIQTTSEHIANIRSSAEGQEGLAAFLEKRQPHWIKK